MCASFDEIFVLRNKAKYTSGRFSGVGRLDPKGLKSNYLLIDKVRALPIKTIGLAFTNRPAKRSQMLLLAGNANKAPCSAAPLSHSDRVLESTGCNTFMMPKAKSKRSKKKQ